MVLVLEVLLTLMASLIRSSHTLIGVLLGFSHGVLILVHISTHLLLLVLVRIALVATLSLLATHRMIVIDEVRVVVDVVLVHSLVHSILVLAAIHILVVAHGVLLHLLVEREKLVLEVTTKVDRKGKPISLLVFRGERFIFCVVSL